MSQIVEKDSLPFDIVNDFNLRSLFTLYGMPLVKNLLNV